MKNTNFYLFGILLITLIGTLPVIGQTTKEAVILYNTVPVLAEISKGGEVNRIIKEDSDFLKGFTLTIQDYGQFVGKQTTADNVIVKSSQNYPIEISDDKTISFSPGAAILSDQAIFKLDNITKNLRADKSMKVTLRTLNTLQESLLSKNRLNSVRSYLKLRGIEESRISYESLKGDKDFDEVKISFKQ